MLMKSEKTQPWKLRKRVLPQHTDHAGVMWHGAYLAWLEEARVEALAQVGLPYERISAAGLEMPVVRLEIHYRRALRHGEVVELESWSLPCDGVRWPWLTVFASEAGDRVADAQVDLVLLNVMGSRRRVLRQPPEPLASALRQLQQGAAPRL
ncbi:MAG: acyl-CoA thioesterase [Prochlorococcus sp. MED-G132]|nr:MAG: acyl-CoA thioesterase [Prochlorococcus sp. MED-G132]